MQHKFLVSLLAAGIAGGHSISALSAALEEVVVTARKVEESLQDVPITVSAFTGDALDAKGLTNISEIGNFTPGLEMDSTAAISGSSAAVTTFIRGIGMSDFLLTIDPGVGLYVDDVYVARSVGGLVDLLDIERVEVLKGPQGTLFGRNTIGGAISIISKDPAREFSGSIGTSIGTDQRFDLRAKVNVPLSENLFSSLSFSSKTKDGYGTKLPVPSDYIPLSVPAGAAPDAFDNGILYGDDDKLGEVNTISARAKFLYEGENLEARLSFDATRARETAPTSTLLGFAPTYGTGAALADAHNAFAVPAGRLAYDERWITGDKHSTYGTAPTHSDYDLFGAALILNWSIGAVDVKSITSYRDLDSDFGRDGDSSPIVLDHTRNQYEHTQKTQEFQFTGLAFNDKLNWLAGIYYFEEDGVDRVQVPLGLEVDLALAGTPGAVINLWLDEKNEVENTSKAVFAQATYSFTDSLSATFGIRRTEDEKTYTPTHVTQGINPIELLIDTRTVKFSDTSPRFSIDYRWNDNLFTYFSYSEAFKSGGFTGRTVDPSAGVRPFEPEEAETLEVGFKIDLDSMRLNGAIFSTDYTNLQLINQEGITPITVNAGTSEISGFELELLAKPTDALTIAAGYSYIDASYEEITDPNATTTVDNKFANTPENSYSLSLDYSIEAIANGSVNLHLDYNWKDDHYNDAENTQLLFQEAFGLLGLSVTYTSAAENWKITAGVANATDELYLYSGFSQPGVGFVEGSYSRGREFYMSASYEFE
jgi:iron complex outermembrane receptor protein